MSSFNLKACARWASVLGLCLGLAACFRPLYGPTAQGESLQDVLAAIDIPENQFSEKDSLVEHYLRSELIFDLNGSGIPATKKYKLTLTYTESLAAPTVDVVSGRALAATVNGNLTYTLTALDGKTPITTGKATSSATYDRFQQRFAAVRADRDAKIRVAKDLADQLRIQIAAALATRT